MTTIEELVSLVHQAQGGDAQAFRSIVERFQDMAYGYAYAILGDFPLAEDAAQEAFIEAYRALPRLRQAAAFPAWFKRIVFKHCDRLRRGIHLPTFPLETGDEFASPSPGPDEIAERRETGSRVQEAIGGLPLHERVATTLFYINGYSQQEIAEFLEVPAKTVKSRLHASRKKLRERMLDMVQEEFQSNALPDDFTRQTVEQAVAQAKEFNREHQYEQAEQVLREALARIPNHPAALKELNRAMMRGKVYGHARWDLLPELVKQGQAVLGQVYDEEVARELAQTLLAVPAMPEAVAFLESWIAQQGPNPERLGMLAWAKGCVADYQAAERLWQEYLEHTRQGKPEEMVDSLPFVCYILVDCLVEAGEAERAQRIARQGWELGRKWIGVPQKELHSNRNWPMLFKQAGLEIGDIVQALLAQYISKPGPEAQGAALSLRAYTDETQEVIQVWLAWVKERIAAGEWNFIESFRFSITSPLRQRGKWAEANQLSQAIWELLGDANDPGADKKRRPWSWERFNFYGYLEQGKLDEVERIARQAIREGEFRNAGAPGLLLVVVARGEPTPTELIQAIEQEGIESLDDYGLSGWYVSAREAAAAGEAEKALEALRKVASFWTNKPYGYDKYWENDPYWGELRQHPEFKRIFAEKRERIGPIYGMLHYFPGW